MTIPRSSLETAINNLQSESQDLQKSALETLLIAQSKWTKEEQETVIAIVMKTLINSKKAEITNLCVKILENSEFEVNQELLLMALSTPTVHNLGLKHLSKFSDSQPVLNAALMILECGSTLAQETAQKELIQIASKQLNIKIFLQKLESGFQALLKGSELVQIRCYELICNLAVISDDSYDALDELNMLDFAKNFNFNDLLLALNMVQIFVRLSSLQFGYSFLQKTGVLNQFHNVLQQDSTPSFILAAVVKFWGLVFFNSPNPQNIEQEYHILHRFLYWYQIEDLAVQDSIVVAIGNCGSNLRGLLILSETPLLAEFTKAYKLADGDFKITCVKTLTCLMSNHYDEASPYCRRIFISSCGHSCESLLQLSKSSIEEVSVSALSCLNEVVGFDWGIENLYNSQSYGILLQREGGIPTAVREWRYSVVKTAYNNVQARSILSEVTFERFEKFVKDGPYKQDYVPSVAFSTN